MSDGNDVRLHVYLRDDVPPPIAERIDSMLERLRRLGDTGRISDAEVVSWEPVMERHEGQEVPPTRRVVEAFDEWASEAGLSLSPAFDHRRLKSSLCDRTYERTVVPIVAIGVYLDDSLCFVAPSRTRARSITVEDCLDVIEESGIDGLGRIVEDAAARSLPGDRNATDEPTLVTAYRQAGLLGEP